MTSSDQPCVEVRREDHLLIITMRREAKRNAINREMADGLDAALNQLDDDDSLWAGVLAGSDSIFCAGSDLTCKGDYITERGGEYGIIRRARRKPLIAAVEGAALGGGLEIVLACDLVVASRSARFGLPEVSIGVLRELILTGDPISAERAHAAGLVNHLTEPGAALPRALKLAGRIIQNAPLSVQESLRSVNEWVASGDELGWRLTGRALDGIKNSEDIREGVRSFLEKRPPKWQGR